MKTFDIVEAVVQAHSLELGDDYCVNEQSLRILCGYCGVVDLFISNQDGRSIEADVVGDNLISVSVELFDFIYESNYKPKSYLALIERAIKVSFINAGDDYVKATFVFPSVWDKKS